MLGEECAFLGSATLLCLILYSNERRIPFCTFPHQPGYGKLNLTLNHDIKSYAADLNILKENV